MSITVTERACRLIDEHHGLDYYILVRDWSYSMVHGQMVQMLETKAWKLKVENL